MLSFLKGTVLSQNNDQIVVQSSGFGLQISVPDNVIAPVGADIELYVHLHWNQENGPSLFGFLEIAQKDLFCMLISVSGIGPRMALALLSAFTVNSLIDALISGNVSLLSSVSGIGRKKAETLILNLKDKAGKIARVSTGHSNAQTGFATHLKDLSDALISLGYTRHEIIQAVDQLRAIDGASDYAFDQLLRKSLQLLAKNR